MKSCRKMSSPRRAAEAGAVRNEGAPAGAYPANHVDHVNRYCHPIRIKSVSASGGTEKLLSYILETLSRQADLLEELLHRTEGEDTR